MTFRGPTYAEGSSGGKKSLRVLFVSGLLHWPKHPSDRCMVDYYSQSCGCIAPSGRWINGDRYQAVALLGPTSPISYDTLEAAQRVAPIV
jgi:hypothetical protein